MSNKNAILDTITKDVASLTNVDAVEYLSSIIDDLIDMRRGCNVKTTNNSFEISKKTVIRKFLKDVSELPKHNKAVLKNSLGKETTESNIGLERLWYKKSDYGISSKNERLWILVARIFIFLGGEFENLTKESAMDFSTAFAKSTTSNSSQERFDLLTHTSMNSYRAFESNLLTCVRIVKSKGYKFNCVNLLYDLLQWKDRDNKVQSKWSNNFYTTLNN